MENEHSSTPASNGRPDGVESLSGADRAAFDNICGDFDIKIARDGTWYYRGSPIGRKRLVQLFSTVLRCDDNGEYWLITPVEKGKIEVEDVPFVVVEMTAEGEGRQQRLTMRTNLDDIVVLDDDHPLRVEVDDETEEPAPYVTVRDNLEARLNRPVFYQLVELAVPREVDGGKVLGVWSAGSFFPIGDMPKEA